MQAYSATPGTWTGEHRSRVLLLIVAVAALILVGLAAVWIASTRSPSTGWMMGGAGGWGWMWGAGILLMVVPVVLLGVFLALLLRSPSSQPPVAATPTDPVAELRMRYARGEITPEQYRRVLDDLRTDR